MNRNDLLKFCKYYKNEKENPYKKSVAGYFWDYEKKWIELSIENGDSMANIIEEYVDYGLADFNMQDDTPLSLKAVIFNRFLHWLGGYGVNEDKENFKVFYNNKYKREG